MWVARGINTPNRHVVRVSCTQSEGHVRDAMKVYNQETGPNLF